MPPVSNRAKATSLDIAHLAGVSQPTVSRALSGSPMVNADTRRRILAIAEQLNYKVDKNASNLRRQHSGTIALLLFEDQTADDSQINPFFVSMLGSITRACGRLGYDLLVSFQQACEDWQAEYEDSHKADGLILLGYGDYLESQTRLQRLADQGTHFVRWGSASPGQPGVSIGCDNVQGGHDITAHLVAQGCTRIAFLGDASAHAPEILERHTGYAAALREAGLSPDDALRVDAITTEQSGHAAATSLLARAQSRHAHARNARPPDTAPSAALPGSAPPIDALPFDAVFCASDLIAIGAMRAFKARGLRVPEDIAVVGFDDIPMASLVTPTLSTVQQDTRLAGELLVDGLLRLVRGEPVTNETIPARLVLRGSSMRG